MVSLNFIINFTYNYMIHLQQQKDERENKHLTNIIPINTATTNPIGGSNIPIKVETGKSIITPL